MLDIGFSELLLTAVVALIVIGPKDLPVVLRHAAKYLRELRGFYFGVKKQMTAMMDEAGLTDMQREMTTIIDLEGKPQQAYDVRELESLRMAASGAAGSASPLAGEATRLAPHHTSPLGGEVGGGLSRSGEGASMQNTSASHAPSSRPSPAGGEGAPASPLVPND